MTALSESYLFESRLRSVYAMERIVMDAAGTSLPSSSPPSPSSSQPRIGHIEGHVSKLPAVELIRLIRGRGGVTHIATDEDGGVKVVRVEGKERMEGEIRGVKISRTKEMTEEEERSGNWVVRMWKNYVYLAWPYRKM
ncbi:hypothetical protein HK104_007641 [Borealophlyctis nickersoniae]|nr:hypothetical protein HK104_007641 [Borealophlyctis nickersoniae]